MTNNLIMQLKIEKAKLEKKLDELNIKLVRLMNELASKSCPYFVQIEDIEAKEIEQIGDELLLTKQEAIDTQEKLKKINKELV